jgi:hypothetical protein
VKRFGAAAGALQFQPLPQPGVHEHTVRRDWDKARLLLKEMLED